MNRRDVSRAEEIAQNLLYNGLMRVYAWLRYPVMTGAERALMKRLLTRLAQRDTDRPLRVFEYGSGNSTVYYGRWMASQGIHFDLDALDNHCGWHERVRERVREARLSERITLHLREFTPFWAKPGWDWSVEPECGKFAPASEAEREYIELPVTLGGGYDLIIVDARFRRRCLEIAHDALAPDGVVLLHDAQKPWYHGPTEKYPIRRFVDGGTYYPGEFRLWQVWLGSMTEHAIEEV